MKKSYPLLFFIFLLSLLSNQLSSQTYQLTGTPVNTTGWILVKNRD